MCREFESPLPADEAEGLLRLYFGGTPPQAEARPGQTATPQNADDVEPAEPVA